MGAEGNQRGGEPKSMARVLPSEAMRVIDQLFPFAAKQLEGTHGEQALQQGSALGVAALIGVVDQVPSELIVLESEDLAAFHAGVEVLRNALGMWQGPKSHNVTYIPGFDSRLNPVALIRRALAKCPNEVIPRETAELAFLRGDPRFRDDLRRDLAHAERAFLHEEWKASTVLSGSVLEALLFWGLSRAPYRNKALRAAKAPKDKKGAVKPLNEWTLSNFVAVAEEVQLLTTADRISEAKLAQNYRNLIHHAREARLNQHCDKGTAQVGAAAVSHVALELATKFHRKR